MSHEEFACRYKLLATNRKDRTIDTREICRQIVGSYSKMKDEIRAGNSQMYATEHGIELAERWKLRIRHQAASVIQRWWHEKMRKKHAAVSIQRWWRAVLRIRAANKVKRWWKKKRSTALMLSKVGQIYRSVRIIQRTVRRWLAVKAINNRSQIPLPSPTPTVEVEEECRVDREVKYEVSPKRVETSYCAKATQTSSFQSFQLSRLNYFYSDGIISIRRPPTVCK